MFLSLLKNIAECFMKAIKGLSFSSANERQPYVNMHHLLMRRLRLLRFAVGFSALFFHVSAFALVLCEGATQLPCCPGVCLDGNRCDVASVVQR